MNDLLKGKRFPEILFMLAALGFAVGLSTSKVVLSISSLLLVLAVILGKDFQSIGSQLKSNKVLWPLLAYLGLHILGLLWTSDFNYAGNDLKTKLTLLIVPLAFVAKPLDKKFIPFLLNGFMISVLITSLVNILSWHQFLGARLYTDIRELSLFGSHIRYGILIAMAAAICILRFTELRSAYRWLFLLLFGWFTYYTYFSQIVSGLLALIVAVLAILFWFSYKRSPWLAYGILSIPTLLVILLTSSLGMAFLTADPRPESFKNLPERTINGNPYTHNLEPGTFIDGKPMLAYLCAEELKRSWNAVSKISYDGPDEKGQPVRFTLMRFLTDLGERKDSVGFRSLTRQDITLIEHGIASREEGEGGLMARWKGVRFQLQNHLDPNGHSLLQRIEYWKTGCHLIQANWLLGVGTGDVQRAFDEQYQKEKSRLLPEYRLRAHNTYLTSWISFGVIGFLLISLLIITFMRAAFKREDVLSFVFILVAASTFLLEDTLETQMGASFFAFFYGIAVNQFKRKETTAFS